MCRRPAVSTIRTSCMLIFGFSQGCFGDFYRIFFARLLKRPAHRSVRPKFSTVRPQRDAAGRKRPARGFFASPFFSNIWPVWRNGSFFPTLQSAHHDDGRFCLQVQEHFFLPPIKATSSSWTILMNCCPGDTDFMTSSPSAFSFTFLTRVLATL